MLVSRFSGAVSSSIAVTKEMNAPTVVWSCIARLAAM